MAVCKNQSQKHGYILESIIRKTIFNLPEKHNDTGIHDIPYTENTLDPKENISIKSTGSTIICCADILRFFNYEFEKKNTIICIKYQQKNNKKIIKQIFEIDYNEKCHKKLFGNCPFDKIKAYVEYIKSIPKGKVDKETRLKYKTEKKQIQEEYKCIIKINPKVDSKTQRRVQCSIPDFENTLKEFITYKSTFENPNVIRNKTIPTSIISSRRIRKK